MARNSRSHRPPARRQGSAAPPTLPDGDVATSTGTARIERDPDLPSAVTLVVNGVPSSHLDLDDPELLTFEYMQQMAAVLDVVPGPLDAVHLGAAGCTLARYLDHTRPGSRQIGVDIDARLLELVREWFSLPRAPRLRLRTADAREALAAMPSASADVVIRDVFAGDTTPPHVATVEFVEEVVRVLRPGGLYLANCADRPPLDVVRAEVATLLAAGDASGGTAFAAPAVGVVAEPALFKKRRYGNFVLAGRTTVRTEDGAVVTPLDSAALQKALRSLPVPARLVCDAEVVSLAGHAAPLRDPTV